MVTFRQRWERRGHRWGDYVERFFLALALVFIVVGFLAIQSSRRETIIRSCEESNMRHDRTLHEYDRVLLVRLTHTSVDASTDPKVVERQLVAKIASLPRDQRSQVDQGRTFIRLIIDQLSPKRPDCSARAERLTQ